MSEIRTLLLIDNDSSHAAVFREALLHAIGGPFEGERVTTLAKGIERAKQAPIWAIFLNLVLPDSKGLATFDGLALAVPGVPTMVLVGEAEEGLALEALNRGAKDYLLESQVNRNSFVRAIRNMAERRAAAEVLFAETERAQVTLNSIGDAVLSTDIHGNVTYLNLVAEQMTGWSRSEAADRPLDEIFRIIDGSTRQPAPNPMQRAIDTNKTVELTANCILIRRDGSEIGIEDSAAPIHNWRGEVTGAVIVFHDVTQSRAMQLEVSHLAQHDILTNLPNRSLLEDRLSQAITTSRRKGGQTAVLYIDLDGFKHINDSFDHGTGDKLLQSVARRLLACVRTSDTVSRQGGDEFVVLLSEIGHARDAEIKAAKILAALTVPYQVAQRTLQVTASIGLATYPEDGEDAKMLITNADLAMYQAKEKGCNNYKCFEKELNVKALARQSVEDSLRNALKLHEFLVHYQPKIDIISNQITGVEALIRWWHPQRGLLGPLEFISIAEDCGLMVPIGQWVLRESCRQAREWQDVGLPPVSMAVNVSSVEFRNEGFLGGVRAILAETRLAPRYLELELTESVLMQHVQFTVPMLVKLKNMGIHLAIDDFGTGYSSLSYLRQFPVDTLKVDQSFVHEINHDTDDATIIGAVISMGRGLKHRVIAEGVETSEQLAFLKSRGCDEAQGFYFSRPLPAVELAKLLQTGLRAAASI